MFLTSTGMICSVGATSASACAAMRAGIAMLEELPYLDNQGEPILGAVAPGHSRGQKTKERLIELLSLALSDLHGKIPEIDVAQVPLLVGLAEPDRPGGVGDLIDMIVPEVEARLGVVFHPDYSRVIARSHTAGFDGLLLSRKLMRRFPEIESCIVCAVDSYINPQSLLWLDEHWRLKNKMNSDGVIPGEAAAAMLVSRNPPTTQAVGVEVSGLGFAHEDAAVLSDEPNLALGLTKATTMALAEARMGFHEIDFRVTDAAGEAYAFKEQSLVECRLMRVHRGEVVVPIWHCAEFIGDVGAAASVAGFVITHEAFAKGYAPGFRAICYGSAVPGRRGAAVLTQIS